MKTISAIFGAVLFLTTFSTANAMKGSDTCTKFLACGSYALDGEGVTYKVVVTGINNRHASLEFIGFKGPDRSVLRFDLKFQADGSFVGVTGGVLSAAGICGKNLCTYSLVPKEDAARGAYGVTGVIRFLNSSLEHSQFVTEDAGSSKISVVYKKE